MRPPDARHVAHGQRHVSGERTSPPRALRPRGRTCPPHGLRLLRAVGRNLTPDSGKLSVTLEVVNQGVAPFYRDWHVELGLLSPGGKFVHTWPTDWKLTGLLPGDRPRRWQTTVDLGSIVSDKMIVAIRVVNPMPNGKPLRFANADQDRDAAGWLSVAKISASHPSASGK